MKHGRDDEHDELGVQDELEEIYLPFSGRRAGDADDDADFDLDDDELDVDPREQAAAVRMRPPPKGLKRRDRREWNRIEVARINRAAEAMSAHRRTGDTGWSGGFIKNPPRRLGRTGRKAWLAAEHEATTAWWAQRRASNRDIQARTAGAAVLALLLGVGVLTWILTHRHDAAPASPIATAPTSLTVLTSTAGETSELVSAAAVQTVPGATGSVAVATVNPAIGATPTVAPPVSGRWQPTPAGGVPAITATPQMAAVSPAAVRLAAAPTGPISVADQASAPAAVTAWLARTCPSSWKDPFGADLQRGKALETAAAWNLDDPARDQVGAALWRSVVVAHQQTRQCGNLTVTVSPDQPLTAHGGFVLFSADRVVTSAAGGAPAVVEQLSGARRVIQVAGKWLVDAAVVGG